MARTTGYTATSAVRMLREGLYDTKGVAAPEFIARDTRCVDFMLRELALRGVHYESRVMSDAELLAPTTGT
jgi:saccharopine dehydrogenase-like NADP-dependent oxidoreductase